MRHGFEVTFIVPTTGKSSLAPAVRSIGANAAASAIVTIDGASTSSGKPLRPELEAEVNASANVQFLRLARKFGKGRQGGPVRNAALDAIAEADGRNCSAAVATAAAAAEAADSREGRRHDARWVAFLDDDDAVDAQYTERLREHSAAVPEADVVVFRLHRRRPTDDTSRGQVLPSPTSTSIRAGDVGITFAMRRSVAHCHRFHRGDKEDFRFLRQLSCAGWHILLSPHVTYYFWKIAPGWNFSFTTPTYVPRVYVGKNQSACEACILNNRCW